MSSKKDARSARKRIAVKAVNTISEENHLQMMRRLGLGGGLVFAHGKPAPRVKKSH